MNCYELKALKLFSILCEVNKRAKIVQQNKLPSFKIYHFFYYITLIKFTNYG